MGSVERNWLFSTASYVGILVHSYDASTVAACGETARGICQLEAAQNLHQTFNLTPGGGPTRFKILLHTQARKERQDHTR